MKYILLSIAVLFLGMCTSPDVPVSYGEYPTEPVEPFDQINANRRWRDVALWECTGVFRAGIWGSIFDSPRQMEPKLEVVTDKGVISIYFQGNKGISNQISPRNLDGKHVSVVGELTPLVEGSRRFLRSWSISNTEWLIVR